MFLRIRKSTATTTTRVNRTPSRWRPPPRQHPLHSAPLPHAVYCFPNSRTASVRAIWAGAFDESKPIALRLQTLSSRLVAHGPATSLRWNTQSAEAGSGTWRKLQYSWIGCVFPQRDYRRRFSWTCIAVCIGTSNIFQAVNSSPLWLTCCQNACLNSRAV